MQIWFPKFVNTTNLSFTIPLYKTIITRPVLSYFSHMLHMSTNSPVQYIKDTNDSTNITFSTSLPVKRIIPTGLLSQCQFHNVKSNWKEPDNHTYLLPGNSFCLSPRCLFVTPSGSSISFSSICWSLESIGAIDMSRTARNWPQLFKCSFSKRKKFHTNLLKKKHCDLTELKKPFSMVWRESKSLLLSVWAVHFLCVARALQIM